MLWGVFHLTNALQRLDAERARSSSEPSVMLSQRETAVLAWGGGAKYHGRVVSTQPRHSGQKLVRMLTHQTLHVTVKIRSRSSGWALSGELTQRDLPVGGRVNALDHGGTPSSVLGQGLIARGKRRDALRLLPPNRC